MHLQQTVADVAALLRGRVTGRGDLVLGDLRALDSAGPEDLAAVFRPQYIQAAGSSRAGCLIVPEQEEPTPALVALQERVEADGRTLIHVADPELAVDTLVATWGPREVGPDVGIHPTAIVEDGAQVDPSVAVGPWAFVGRGARVGPGTRLWARAFVGAFAVVGAGCKLYPGTYLGERCTVGDRVVLHAGAVLGADGFGFRPGPDGEYVKSPQVGIVAVGDDVEIGANTTIDRARLEATTVGKGVKIDDQVMVAHNCSIGEHTVIAGHSSLAGGAQVGKHVVVAGRVAINGSISILDGTVLGGGAVVMKAPAAGDYVLGHPAVPHRQFKRQALSLERLPALIADMKAGRLGGTRGAP
jgi:UDP-3-O-[3-hydroxymyristoyl] glucosamine N-acyltransferase